MKRNTYIAIVCAILLLAGGLYYFVKDEPLPPPAADSAAAADPAGFLSFSGTTYVEQKDGKPQWEITAETIEMDPKTKIIYLKGIKGTFYQDNGGKIEMTAPLATMDSKTKDITMQGNVKATSSDGAVFTAKEALWAAQDRRIFGFGGVTLTRGDTVITGEKIETDNNMQKFKVQGNARILQKGAD
ncbi:MAG: LPS export ABC transporter periplasmic protein LptC [Negativicutes bacterium]|nr:LPS export ABC transporter periplasmic protein LptC [Negativicutes bacterium]